MSFMTSARWRAFGFSARSNLHRADNLLTLPGDEQQPRLALQSGDHPLPVTPRFLVGDWRQEAQRGAILNGVVEQIDEKR